MLSTLFHRFPTSVFILSLFSALEMSFSVSFWLLFDDIFVYAFPLQVYFVDYLKRCKNYGVTDIVSIILPEFFSYF